MVDYVKYCREAADETFYDPLKESWNMVGDHIEKLEAALDDVAGYLARADWYYLKPETRKALEKNED